MYERKPFNLDDYIKRIQSGTCFICEMIAGRLDGNHVIYQDDAIIVFLNKFPVLYGYVLMAPIEHKEDVTGDFTVDEYLAFQRAIYHTAEAVKKVVPTESLYILSLGSQKGNRHVHWHIAPLPPGIPFKEQQLEALRSENGILDIPEQEMKDLARQIRRHLNFTAYI